MYIMNLNMINNIAKITILTDVNWKCDFVRLEYKKATFLQKLSLTLSNYGKPLYYCNLFIYNSGIHEPFQ